MKLKIISKSYDRYQKACQRYGLASASFERYFKTYLHANDYLSEEKITLDNHPFIVYNIDGLVIKFKKLTNEETEVNFFKREDYDEVIGQYKENEQEKKKDE